MPLVNGTGDRSIETEPASDPVLKWVFFAHLKAHPPTCPGWNSTALAVLLTMWGCASVDGTDIRPGDESIARMAGCSVETVRRQRRRLQGWNLIERVTPANSQGMAAVYRLRRPEEWSVHDEAQSREGVGRDPEVQVADDPGSEPGRCPNRAPSSGVRCVRPKGHGGGCRVA